MDTSRRRFLTAAGCLCLASGSEALAGSNAPPVVAVIDVDTPAARKGFEAFAALLDRRFAGRAVRPRAVFIGHEFVQFTHQVNKSNADALRAAVVNSRADILLASSDGYAQLLRLLDLGKPILFFTALDPIAIGLTDSLTRPGLGMSGFALGSSSALKRFEMLLRLAPKARSIGHLSSAGFDREGRLGAAISLPARETVTIRRFEFSAPADLAVTLSGVAARQMDAWDVSYASSVFLHSEPVVKAIGKLHRPAIYPRMKFIHMGGMAAFEPRLEEAREVWVSQVASLLAGVPIENIPVVQATRYRFGLNLKACKRVGIEPPKSLLRIADVVIE